MTFINPVAEDEASGETAAMYEEARAGYGYLPNMTKAFSHRPDVMAAWNGLAGAVRGNMTLRRYELATLAAARELRSSYCLLAHGTVMLREFFSEDELKAIVEDGKDAPISDEEKAVMAYAGKVARDASSVTQADIDGLRAHGLTDAEIFDVAAAAAMRCFFSKTLDATGARPDAAYAAIGTDLRKVLTAGRPIDGA